MATLLLYYCTLNSIDHDFEDGVIQAANTEAPKKVEKKSETKPAPKAAPKAAKKEEKKEEKADDDFDLFDDDNEDDEEYERLIQERIKKMEAEKAAKGKKKAIAKSQVVFDVKPWGEDTDLAEVEKMTRAIELDGLVWSKSELKPVAYGLKKLVIAAVVEDDKVSADDLQEKIEAFEDHVQSVDVVSFSKV